MSNTIPYCFNYNKFYQKREKTHKEINASKLAYAYFNHPRFL